MVFLIVIIRIIVTTYLVWNESVQAPINANEEIHF
jgi:hypothetical protein